MAERPDYYAALGVARDASRLDIKRAYRRLANTNHPDRHPDDAVATRRFQGLVEAYDVLGDEDRRAAYDAGQVVTGVRVEAGTPLEELLGLVVDHLFGVRERAPLSGRDRLYHLSLDLPEAALGSRKELSLPSDLPCEPCDGRGFALDHLPEICARCGGPGVVQRRRMLRSGIESCPSCDGRGFLLEEACSYCQGCGRKDCTRTIAIDIPPGVTSGRRLKVRDAGEPGAWGGPAGDCIVVLSVMDHPHLTRRGLDVTMERPVTLFQALLGGWVWVPTLEGVARLQLPAGTESGARLKMVGKGVLTPDGARGDQVVTVQVESPGGLDGPTLDALGQIAETIDMDAFPQTRQFEEHLSTDGDESRET